jgi:hypothetical protein
VVSAVTMTASIYRLIGGINARLSSVFPFEHAGSASFLGVVFFEMAVNWNSRNSHTGSFQSALIALRRGSGGVPASAYSPNSPPRRCALASLLCGTSKDGPTLADMPTTKDQMGRGRRRIVAQRLREFFAALLARFSGGSAELFDKAKLAAEEPTDKRPP